MKLYLISPPQIELNSFAKKLEMVAETGLISFFQLRLKEVSDAEILAAAKKLITICSNHNIKFIINDSPKLAFECGTDGVHIGIDDGSVTKAREVIGANKIVGVSCYNSLELAEKAASEGADYVSFGAFYPTKTKIPRSKAEIETVSKWKKRSEIPCSAIGGITPENAKPIIAAGADYICVVSSVWDAENQVNAVKRFFL